MLSLESFAGTTPKRASDNISRFYTELNKGFTSN